jgi:hypothetical protein
VDGVGGEEVEPGFAKYESILLVEVLSVFINLYDFYDDDDGGGGDDDDA